MLRTGAAEPQRLPVIGRAVAAVTLEAVGGIPARQIVHQTVSVDLRDSALLKQTPLHLNLDSHTAVLGLSARW